MSDMPEWRAWADRVHAELMRPAKRNRNTRLNCSTKCGHRTTKNQAKKNGWVCFHCKSPLSSKGPAQ